MALIAGISGIRGTMGNTVGENLTREDVERFVSAYASLIATKRGVKKIVVGRDARPSGVWIKKETLRILTSFGITVIDLDLATTPTIELAVKKEKADGGIVISASHNPPEWNGLKFLSEQGEFASALLGKKIVARYKKGTSISSSKKKGRIISKKGYEMNHIKAILRLPLVKAKKIKEKKFTVVVDGINSVGGIAIPKLLKALGVARIIELNTRPTGKFAHMPEPLPENLTLLGETVRKKKADMGIAVDPDGDRLVFFDEKGVCVGEEYTVVLASEYVLSKRKGNTLSNLSSSRALRDITLSYGGKYFAAPVGETPVVKEMKKKHVVIGGEGGGKVIFPPLLYASDSLVGTALVLSLLSERGKSLSELRALLPQYEMVKEKVALSDRKVLAAVLEKVKKMPTKGVLDTRDGIRIDFPDSWVSIRSSNTEPIVRIFAEAHTKEEATKIASEWKKKLLSLV